MFDRTNFRPDTPIKLGKVDQQKECQNSGRDNSNRVALKSGEAVASGVEVTIEMALFSASNLT